MTVHVEGISRLTMEHGRRPRVAIVCASQIGCMVASALIEQFGCTPVLVPSGESVLALLRLDERVDLAIVDLSLPDMDGVVALQMIRALGARGALPVIALAGRDEENAAMRASAAGFAGAVVKPYSPRELYTAMLVALTGANLAIAGAEAGLSA